MTFGNPNCLGNLRVNDDVSPAGRSQFFPSIAVDQTSGKLAICWYDCRNDASNTNTQFFAAFSSDKGVTLWKNFQVSGFLFSNAGLSYGYYQADYGDYAHCAFQSGKFFPLWADNSNSTGDNPSELNPNPGPTYYNPMDIYTRKIF